MTTDWCAENPNLLADYVFSDLSAPFGYSGACEVVTLPDLRRLTTLHLTGLTVSFPDRLEIGQSRIGFLSSSTAVLQLARPQLSGQAAVPVQASGDRIVMTTPGGPFITRMPGGEAAVDGPHWTLTGGLIAYQSLGAAAEGDPFERNRARWNALLEKLARPDDPVRTRVAFRAAMTLLWSLPLARSPIAAAATALLDPELAKPVLERALDQDGPPLHAWAAWRLRERTVLRAAFPKLVARLEKFESLRPDGEKLCVIDNVVSVRLNSLLYSERRHLSKIAAEIEAGRSFGAESLALAINRSCFDGTGYYDLSWPDRRPLRTPSAAAWTPLWAGVATAVEVPPVLDLMMGEFWTPLPFPQSPSSEVHLADAWLAVEALRKYALDEEAAAAERRILDALDVHPALYPSYHPQTFAPSGAPQCIDTAAALVLMLNP